MEELKKYSGFEYVGIVDGKTIFNVLNIDESQDISYVNEDKSLFTLISPEED